MKNLFVFVLILTASTSFAQPKHQGAIALDTNMISLMTEAKKLMKSTDNIPYPEIYPASLDYLRSLVCNNSSYCPVTAVYYENKIYYRQDLDLNNSFTKSILVHEFVHHIQANSGFVATDCNIWYKNEKEAYRLQAKYLRNNNQDDSPVREAVRIIKCP